MWVYRNKGTSGPIGLCLVSGAHGGLATGTEVANDNRDSLSVFDFLENDALLIN